MEFSENKSIYLQICDAICERILSGELAPDSRIPSVREYGAEIGVNPNTVMRSYEKLTGEGIIYNKRGIGYFISPDAQKIVMETQKEEFLKNELPQILKRSFWASIQRKCFSTFFAKSLKMHKFAAC